MPAFNPRIKSLLDLARSLGPLIGQASDQADRDRELPTALFQTLADCGFYRLLVPRSLGGYELDLPTYIQILEDVARADGSTAWCLSQANGYSMVSAFLEPQVARAIFSSDPRTYVANGQGPAKAMLASGGYRVTGRWSFSSGYRHASWLSGMCPIHIDGQPRRLADGTTETREMLFPTSQATLSDVWNVAGLRGTGSQQFSVDELFVPSDFSVSIIADRKREYGALYVFPRINVFAIGFASVALGIARGALDAFAELAGAKTPRGMPAALRDQATVQADTAQAEARLRSARAYLRETVADTWISVGESGVISVEQRALIRLAATHSIHLAAEAVDLAYALAGSTAIYADCPLQRQFQDIHVVTQHVQARRAHYESVGRHFLGLEPDYVWL